MRAARILLEWVIPWLTLSLGVSGLNLMASKILVIEESRPSHNNQFCSTWGNFYLKTFDGDFFQNPSTCNYIFTSHCKVSYEMFNIKVRRQEVDGELSIQKIVMKLDEVVVELANNSVQANSEHVSLPFNKGGVSIQKTDSYIKIEDTMGLVLMWNQQDSLWVELDEKFKNQTCGLCGDFNEESKYNEFIQSGVLINNEEYANIWKADGPEEVCNAIPWQAPANCSDKTDICKNLLTGAAFLSCQDLINTEYFIEACAKDLCNCISNKSSCLCSTVSEYSRQCAHAGGKPQEWKTKQLCAKSCPFNMVYKECGTPCTDTCRNRHKNKMCMEHCTDGCFCPEGTVFDDVSQSGCIPVSQCSCRHHGKIYKPGDSYTEACRTCTCNDGEWNCAEKDCPGICSILGGSHFSTYDDNMFDFHGECLYTLSKAIDGAFSVFGDLAKCDKSEKSTCLSSVTLR